MEEKKEGRRKLWRRKSVSNNMTHNIITRTPTKQFIMNTHPPKFRIVNIPCEGVASISLTGKSYKQHH